MRKGIFITEETHAKLTDVLRKEVVKRKGVRVTFDEIINLLIEKK